MHTFEEHWRSYELTNRLAGNPAPTAEQAGRAFYEEGVRDERRRQAARRAWQTMRINDLRGQGEVPGEIGQLRVLVVPAVDLPAGPAGPEPLRPLDDGMRVFGECLSVADPAGPAVVAQATSLDPNTRRRAAVLLRLLADEMEREARPAALLAQTGPA